MKYKMFPLLIFYILVSHQQGFGQELPYSITVVPVKSVGNTDTVLACNLKTNIELELQNSKYFVIIGESFTDKFIESIWHNLSVLKAFQINQFGGAKTYEYIIAPELTKDRDLWKSKWTLKLFWLNIKTFQQVVFTGETTDDPNTLVKTVCKKLINTICEAVVTLNITPPTYNYFLKSNYLNMTNGINLPSISMYLPFGEYTLKITKNGYRDFDTTLTLKPGEKLKISKILREKGSYILIHGSPIDALILINKIDKSMTQKKCTFGSNIFLHEGQYSVLVKAPGFQSYSETIYIEDLDEKIEKPINLHPLERTQYVKRSILLPGLGQIGMGHNIKGFTLLAGFTVTIFTTIVTHDQYLKKNQEIGDLFDKYRLSSGINAQLIHDQIVEKEQWRNRFYNSRNVLAISALGIYAYNLYDIFFPSKRTPDKIEKKKPKIPDDSIFNEIGLNVSHPEGITLTCSLYLR